MASKIRIISRFVLIVFILFLAATASADDEAQLKYLPGSWTISGDIEEEGEAPLSVDLILMLEEDGTMSLSGSGDDAGYAYTYRGTWSSEYVPEELDRLTLHFTSTDNPLYADTEYNIECVFEIYSESWVDNNTWNIYFILSEHSFSGVTPLEDIYGYNDIAMKRVQGPNMKVVRCKDYVSLRDERSTRANRVLKVPLGAEVLAFPEYGYENGFTACAYQGEYGYILSEYLQPID